MTTVIRKLGILGCLIVSATSFTLAFRAPPSPFLVEQPVIELGVVEPGESITKTVPLVNK